MKKRKILIEHEGKLLTLKELSSASGISLYVLIYRYNNGERGERLLRPERSTVKLQFRGKQRTIHEISQMTGIPSSIIRGRSYKGRKGEELVRPLRTPKKCLPLEEEPDNNYTAGGILYTEDELYELYRGFRHKGRSTKIELLRGFMACEERSTAVGMLNKLEERYAKSQTKKNPA